MATTKLQFVFSADTAQGITALKGISSELKGVGTQADTSTKQASSGIGTLTGTLGTLKGAVLGLGAAFGVLSIAGAFGDAIKSVVAFEREFANVSTLYDTSQVSTVALM